MKRIGDAIEALLLTIASLCFVAVVAVVFVEVFSRWLLGTSYVWTNEVARLAFLYSTFFAASVGFRHADHLTIDLINFLPGSLPDRVHEVVISLFNLAYTAMYAVLATWLVQSHVKRYFPVLGLPLAVGWAAIAVMGFAGLYFSLERLAGDPSRTRRSTAEPAAPAESSVEGG